MSSSFFYNLIMNYYAVKKGKKPGVYLTWDECKAQVNGFSGAEYKKFNNKEDALDFVGAKKPVQASLFVEESFGNEEKHKETTGRLIAYVDGSFDVTDFSYSYGAVIIDGDKIKTFSKRFSQDKYSEHRNVIGEIRGSMFAMNYALENGYKFLILHYDYEGIEKWATGSWKRNKEATVKYYNFYSETKEKLKVTFVKVKAHTGDKYNEMADKLAKEATIKS